MERKKKERKNVRPVCRIGKPFMSSRRLAQQCGPYVPFCKDYSLGKHDSLRQILFKLPIPAKFDSQKMADDD